MYSKVGLSHHQHRHHNDYYSRPNPAPAIVSPEIAQANEYFDLFATAPTFKSVLNHYRNICDLLRIKPTNFRHFYPKIRNKLRSWKAQAIWNKLDKRAGHKCYNHGKAAANSKVLIIGCGPCGLRTAIEAQLLGAKVVVVEKRDRFSRNNVLHLWPFVITDLKALAAKKFYGKFCAGAIDHISIRQLQCMLLKVALLLGVEVFEGVGFESLVEPPDDQSERTGWRATFSPPEHPVNQYEFDVLVGADGKRNTLSGFKRKEFRGKLAIAITANFINKHTEDDARVEEISGVAFIFNQKFFKDLYSETRIDLENIVYYKDDTHYFVMTAKKHSLLDKGVILQDLPDTQQLLHPKNVDRNALLAYAREAAGFSTNYRLPNLEFAVNHYGKPDVAMFDFTSMFAAENACRIIEKKDHKLLKCLVGDSLLEPFWPTGSGCARGFLSAFDAAWAMRSFAGNKMSPLEVIAERESIYRLLAQTTPQNLSKDHSGYSLDPSSRYPTINMNTVLPFQVRNLYESDEPANTPEAINSHLVGNDTNDDMPKKRKRRDSLVHPETLLNWCRKQVALYSDLNVEDMSMSFKDGRVLCAIIHRYRPDLIDFDSISAENIEENNQRAFNILETEFGVPPLMTGAEMSKSEIPDKLSMISYISQVHDAFRGVIPHFKHPTMDEADLEQELLTKKSRATMPAVNILKNLTSCDNNVINLKNDATIDSRDDGRISCRILDEDSFAEKKSESMKRNKKRRSGRLTSPQDKYEKLHKRAANEPVENFSDRVKGLEAKFSGSSSLNEKKPKDMIRAIGKIEKSDWNLAAIEKKIDETGRANSKHEKEKVPKWNKDQYEDKFHNIERRLRENGEDEATIAKYRDIDASLQRLEKKLKEGSSLDIGMRGANKVSNLASQLSSKLERKVEEKTIPEKPSRPVVPMPSSGSDLCHFCGTRVYLVERLSTEGKFFHRQCFKCDYCGALLRLGNYIYDREGRYGGKFFCIPHWGLTAKAKNRRKPEDNDSAKENIVPENNLPYASNDRMSSNLEKSTELSLLLSTQQATSDISKKTTPIRTHKDNSSAAKVFRGTTPERVEFENSVVEQSDEDEYLSEDEWTDRNFGASANELDDSESDENSDYSDLSDEEAEEEEIPFNESGLTFTAKETRKMVESWQRRRYSTDKNLDADGEEFESDLESDHTSEEYNAEGDDSHTATEGEFDGIMDGYDEEREADHRARELRRQELNINVEAPPCESETSESGSDTEIATEDESDTQIDTDSEFADDANIPKEIPKIVIDESLDQNTDDGETKIPDEPIPQVEAGEKGRWTHRDQTSSTPSADHISQKIDLDNVDSDDEKQWHNDERSSSLTNLNEIQSKPNPHTEHLKRLLERTESNEAIQSQRLHLRRQYLLGTTTNLPRKSVSTADLGNKFKSFMDKISETQKMLNPAPQPSPAMQVFMSTTVNKSPVLSPSAPNIPGKEQANPSVTSVVSQITQEDIPEANKSETNEDGSSENSKSEDLGKFYSFPVPVTTTDKITDKASLLKSSDSLESNYDNIASNSVTPAHSDEMTIESKYNDLVDNFENVEESYDNLLQEYDNQDESGLRDYPLSSSNTVIKLYNTNLEKENKKESDLDILSKNISDDEFGEIKGDDCEFPSICDTNTIETINPEIISLNDVNNKTCDNNFKLTENNFSIEILEKSDFPINNKFTETSDNIIDKNIKSVLSNKSNLDSDHDNDLNIVLSPNESNDIDNQFEQLVNDSIKDDLISHIDDPTENKPITSGSEADSGIRIPLVSDETITDVSKTADNTITSTCDTGLEDTSIKSLNKSDNFDHKLNDELSIKSVSNNSSNLARIASIESLGDTDSIISTTPSKTISNTTKKPSVLNELDSIEYMDTSESTSSPEGGHNKYNYSKLKEETPTTPIAPSIYSSEMNSSLCSKSSEDSSQESTSLSHSSNKSKVLKDNVMNKNSPIKCDQSLNQYNISPVTPVTSEPKSIQQRDSLDFTTPTKRYEGYIPRFKDRTPTYNYGDPDIYKNSSRKSLSLSSPNENGQINETKYINDPLIKRDSSLEPLLANESSSGMYDINSSNNKDASYPLSKQPTSPPPIKKGVSSIKKKESEGDLIASLVLTRIKQKSDKTRKSSRTNPLSTTSSKSSLFSPQSSQENLLEKLNNRDECELSTNGNDKDNVNINNFKNSYQNIDKPFISEHQLDDTPIQNFKNSNEKIHKSSQPATPLIHQGEINTISSSQTCDSFKTPSIPKQHPIRPRAYSESRTPLNNRTPNTQVSTADRYKSREAARERAKLLSDQDLGLSPPDLAESLRVKLRQHSFSENEGEEKSMSNGLTYSENQLAISGIRSRSNSTGVRPTNQLKSVETPKNKDDRVRELLQERRQKDNENHSNRSSVEREDRIREKLEEYRQKRSSACIGTISLGSKAEESVKISPSKTNLTRRHTHRPSMLELESMSVFTSPKKDSEKNYIPYMRSPSGPSAFDTTRVNEILTSPVIPLQKSASEITTTPVKPIKTPDQISREKKEQLASSEKVEKRPVKKSKDRERRRSLIQVFAGMFSKSDDKKKSQDNLDEPQIPSSSPAESTKPVIPRSPHTVKDKLSRLRISRSKHKNKPEKNRSSSADFLDDKGSRDDLRSPISLPTSPSHQLYPTSPYYRSDSSNNSPPYASGKKNPSSITTPSPKPSRIPEESLSDEEMKGTLERGRGLATPGSSGRKQKAAVRAVKQAELKRLRMAQEIQRQLEECEVKTRELEERGVSVEKSLRGEPGGISKDEAELMGEWFSLVHEKNALVRWEQELMVKAKELELEDRHVRLENELRNRMSQSEQNKSREDIDREGVILAEMLSIMEQKDALFTMLEEDRQRYLEEDKDLESVMSRKGLQVSPKRKETGV